jgi:hypothetical protein
MAILASQKRAHNVLDLKWSSDNLRSVGRWHAFSGRWSVWWENPSAQPWAQHPEPVPFFLSGALLGAICPPGFDNVHFDSLLVWVWFFYCRILYVHAYIAGIWTQGFTYARKVFFHGAYQGVLHPHPDCVFISCVKKIRTSAFHLYWAKVFVQTQYFSDNARHCFRC